jgi:hypothetical protein
MCAEYESRLTLTGWNAAGAAAAAGCLGGEEEAAVAMVVELESSEGEVE